MTFDITCLTMKGAAKLAGHREPYVCPDRDFWYCQECKGHGRCEDEITDEPEEE